MDWECWQGVHIPITGLHQLWTSMVCLPFTSTNHSNPIRPLRFWLELKCLPIPEGFYSSTCYATCAVMD